MTTSIATATLFLGGFAAIQVLGHWARQVTEALVFLLAVTLLAFVALLLGTRWPDYYANPNIPLTVSAVSYDD